jgi:crotonobetainyl-CoA:carnitine CoA-transferase CaiB-like acyl-CoA transferase
MLPLHGVRVLDVTNVLAGPFCSYQLVLLGAEVIKIEQPVRGDLARQLGVNVKASERLMGDSFVSVNAGKQSVTLDLKSPQGKSIFKQLVGISDVVIENFRPGVMRRLGLDYNALSQTAPALVYCALSGFGQEGPLSLRPAYDQIIQGMSGVMSVTGDQKTAPLRTGYPVCDTLGGVTAAMAICAALVEARATGHGRMIDVSMLESSIACMGWIVSNYLNAGVIPVPMGNENFTAAPSGTFQTGGGLLNIAANENAQYHKLCDVIGRPDLKTDPRFADRDIRKSNRALINREITQALQARTAPEWDALLTDAGVPAGCVLSVPEILAHPHLTQRKFAGSYETSSGPQHVTRGGFYFPRETPLPETPAPELSQHTVQWLKKLGYDENAIQELKKAGVT